jgi:hypothetical protein
MNQGLSIANGSLSSSSFNSQQVDEGDAISDLPNNINSWKQSQWVCCTCLHSNLQNGEGE